MSGASTIARVIRNVPENKLIFASKLYENKLREQATEAAYYQTLGRLCRTGALCRIGKGTYYRPRKGKYGVIPLSQSEIISAFTQGEGGTVIGYALYHSLGLTTQVPKTVEVLSAKMEQQSKQVGNVLLRFCDLEYTPKVINALHMLEVLQNFEGIQELNYRQFLRFCEKFSATYSEDAVQRVVSARRYKKKTLAFLQGILGHYGVKNGLKRYLSVCSKYQFPSMEELYESARLS